MSRVERRPTVARNFIGGDRRSIESALEHWMSARPAVTHVSLNGDPLFVTATAQGMHDLGVLQGLTTAPFSVEAHLPAAPLGTGAPEEMLAAATGARAAQSRDLAPGDIIIAVDVQGMEARQRDQLLVLMASTRAAVILVQQPSVPLHDGIRPLIRLPHVRVVPTALEALLLAPTWEAVVEDATPSRLALAGAGMRLFGAAVACGDFYLERLAEVPGHQAARQMVHEHVMILEDLCTVPPSWSSVASVHRAVAQQCGASVVTTASSGQEGVVITPEQRVASAA